MNIVNIPVNKDVAKAIDKHFSKRKQKVKKLKLNPANIKK